MPAHRSKLRSESGNAIVEFIFVFCIATASLLVLALQVELQIRAHLAALSLANETLRSYQLSGSRDSALQAAERAAQVFGLPASARTLELQDFCSVRSLILVRASVRDAVEVASANC